MSAKRAELRIIKGQRKKPEKSDAKFKAYTNNPPLPLHTISMELAFS